MEKFESWNSEHEELVAKREETHRKHKAEKRQETMRESVRKVEEKNLARAAEAETAEAEAETSEGGSEETAESQEA
jgi:small subunit ribosomal protein S16